jgi:4-amino-4-deoxy-L-arabinose transferase-like glycosyltransferase
VRRQILRVSLFVVLISTAVRLPFFFTGINSDESTYILIGQSLLEGHLPYTELWDLKPPLAFLFYASAIALGGKSIVAVRIMGTFCVALTGLLIYLVGQKLWNSRTGIAASMLFVTVSIYIPAGRFTLTEHIAIVPLVCALSLFVIRGLTARNLFLAGILIAMATLVRLNLAYVAVIVGFLVVFAVFAETRSISRALKYGLAYAGGGCLVIVLTSLPYAVTGQQRLLWSSAVIAPLNYSSSQLTFLGALKEQTIYVRQVSSNVGQSFVAFVVLVWLGGFAGLLAICIQWRSASRSQRLGLAFLVVFLSGTEISILRSGAAYPHYLIQLLPFVALTAAAFLNACSRGYSRWPVSGISVVALGLSMLASVSEYRKLASRLMKGQLINNDAAYEVAAYLKQANASGESMYVMTDHIVYWLTNSKPMSKETTHPSAISKQYLLNILVGPDATTETELAKILARKPRFIVKERNVWYLRENPAARFLLEETLKRHYELVKQIHDSQQFRDIQVYRRSEEPSGEPAAWSQ